LNARLIERRSRHNVCGNPTLHLWAFIVDDKREYYPVAQDGKPELLFKVTHGTVTATVYGPRIGFQWVSVEYFRWMLSTKVPGKWERRAPDREVDQLHLEQCVKAVRAWLKQRDSGNAFARKPPRRTRRAAASARRG
jgi:hypothetical protein